MGSTLSLRVKMFPGAHSESPDAEPLPWGEKQLEQVFY